MPVRESLKDSENYQLVAGLDEDGEAQGLTFHDDMAKVSFEESVILSTLSNLVYVIKPMIDDIIDQLKIMNLHLSNITDNHIEEID